MHRCRQSVEFSLQCAWLLDAYSSDASLPSQKKSHGTKLKNLILSDELRPKASAPSAAAASAVVGGKAQRQLTLSLAPLSNDNLPRESDLLVQVKPRRISKKENSVVIRRQESSSIFFKESWHSMTVSD